MKIQKRDGTYESISLDKIRYRLQKLKNDKALGILDIDIDTIALKVVSSIYDGVSSRELDEEASRIAVSMSENPEFQQLGSRIIISNHHKSTNECFSEVMEALYNNTDKSGNHSPIIADDVINIIRENKNVFNLEIDYNRDYMFDYFGFKTLEKSYLLKIYNKDLKKMVVVERPQHLYMRVAIGIHKDDVKNILKTYHLISQHYYTHATPTLFNSGTRLSSLSSCFHEDTIVATINKGPIKIKDVEIGDTVITHLGNNKKVLQIHKNLLNDRKLYEINIAKTVSIQVTDNHKLYGVMTKRNKSGGKSICGDPQWIEVKDLKKGDYICIPNNNNIDYTKKLDISLYTNTIINNNIDLTNNYTFEITEEKITQKTHFENMKNAKVHNTVNRFWNIDGDFAKFVGVFYGDGNIITLKTRNIIKPKGISITINDKNKTLIEFCKNYGEKLFGIKSSVHNIKNQNITQVSYHSVIIGEIFKELFGIHFNNKKIWLEIFKWEKYMVKKLVEGLITTDGCISKNNNVSIQMSNVKFMRDLYYLLRNNNIDTSYGNIKKQKGATENHIQISIPLSEININNINKTYTDNRLNKVHNPLCKNQYSPKIYNGFKFLKFENKIEIKENLPKYVYTLGVEDDHSYNVGGIIAENCFLIGTHDSLEGIFKTMTDCAKISKLSGGIGFHVSNIRAKGSIIRGTNGTADGLVPMLKVYNEISKYIDQGGGKRKGSFACYLEPHHADILEFLDLKKNQGSENMRARDLFYAIWMSDLFMKIVENNGDWYLMCPDECPGLSDVYGEEYENLYWKYVKENRYKKIVKAQEIWTKILELQIEKGVPYIGYKDAVNKKCNQKNLGTIKSSNLCMEISLYSDKDEYGTCNLCSVALPKFVEYDENNNPFFNFEKLREISEYIIEPMNKVIDNNHYPTPEAKYSNMKNRPLGIGVQGLADVYFKMGLPSDSKEAIKLNKEIFETLYYGCMQGTINASKKDGPYESFNGSPFSEGKLQFDLSKEFDNIDLNNYLSGRWDWDTLRKDLVKYGARNSMLTALMPTASTAQIMNNSEAFELVDSCIFKRRVLSGEFMVVNKYLVKDLQKLGLWNADMKNLIIANDGSIQNIDQIPANIKLIYRNVWETSMKSVIDQAKDRQVFIDQMQSMNLFMANPTISKLTSMHFYAWRNPDGKPSCKSGQYYLRSRGSYQSGKFSIDANLEKQLREKKEEKKEETIEDECLACGS